MCRAFSLAICCNNYRSARDHPAAQFGVKSVGSHDNGRRHCHCAGAIYSLLQCYVCVWWQSVARTSPFFRSIRGRKERFRERGEERLQPEPWQPLPSPASRLLLLLLQVQLLAERSRARAVCGQRPNEPAAPQSLREPPDLTHSTTRTGSARRPEKHTRISQENSSGARNQQTTHNIFNVSSIFKHFSLKYQGSSSIMSGRELTICPRPQHEFSARLQTEISRF